MNIRINYDSYFTHESINITVYDGTYASIESQSSQDPCTESDDDKKFAFLGELLAKNELPHRQIIGSYEGFETKYSFFIVKPENVDLQKFRKIIFDLGEQFKQESVILSTKNSIELVYTTGEHKGTAWVGNGFDTNIGENYSKLSTSDGKEYFIGQYYLDRQNYVLWKV